MTGIITADWIEKFGGAERVLDSFVGMYPDADVYCLWNDAPDRYTAGSVIESPLARTPLRGRKAAALPLMPLVWNALRGRDGQARDYDWMLVSSYLFAHHARAPRMDPSRKFVYVHTPARYLWTPELDSRGMSAPVRLVAPVFRKLDGYRARQNANLAANSTFVQERIRKAWGLESTVIHPPVNVASLQAVDDWRDQLSEDEQALLDSLPADFLLGASRFVPYKRLDVVLDAGVATGRPVVIAGSGPGEADLRAYARTIGCQARFIIEPSDSLMAALMQRALVYIFPPIEDFGIMPVEAMALGTPVLVNSIGGAAESCLPGRTGTLLEDFTPESLVRGVSEAAALNPEQCQLHARTFDLNSFRTDIADWMAA